MTATTNGKKADMPTTVHHVAIYAYENTAQADSDNSLESQLDRLRQAARERGWSIVAEYADIGLRSCSRKGLDMMLAAAVGQPRLFDGVLVENVSKLSRDFALAEKCRKALEEAGVSLVVVDSLDDEAERWMMRSIVALYNESTRKHHSERTKRGIAQARARRAAGGSEAIASAGKKKVRCKTCAGLGWEAGMIANNVGQTTGEG